MEDRSTPEDMEDSVSRDGGDGTQLLLREKGRRAVHLLHRDFRAAYGQPYVLKWSLWWALGMCGNFQVVVLPVEMQTKHWRRFHNHGGGHF